jgi:hypothetical protein
MDPLTRSLDLIFAAGHARSMEFLGKVPDDILFTKPRDLPRTFTMFSVGEYIIRSAAEVEKTIGGITTRLWDDPFEWTLPEELHSGSRVADYLIEVELGRSSGFGYLASDADLSRSIPAPERMRTIFELLAGTLVRSAHYQGRAFAVFQSFSDIKLPPP